MADQGYIVEFQRVGSIIRVTAIDPDSGLEAVIQGPISAGEAALASAAAKKLQYLLQKRQHSSGGGGK